MSETAERLTKLATGIEKATAAAQDGGASPVLLAVLEEFRRKNAKALGIVSDGDETAAREAVVEVEQAADSAKAAAEADTGLAAEARDAIVAAHDRICVMKTKWGS